MKNIFLDCGSNIGQGFEHFKQIYGDSYEYHLYEPNPNCFSILVSKYGNINNVFLNNKAVFINNTQLKFYFTDDFSEGGSIVEKHNNNYYDNNKVNSILVDCIDINLLIDQYDSNDNIVLKLDVESSEYDIIEYLIETKTIFKLNKIYCEFHSQYMKDETKKKYLQRENNIIKFMEENKINFQLWH